MQLTARRWWTLKESDLANEVVNLCSSLERQDAPRRTRYQKCLCLYEGQDVSLDSDQFRCDVPSADFIDPLYNLVRSAVDSAQADIAGRQKPKPMFLTTGADWKARRRAKKLDRFVEAQLNEKQGCYADSWQLMLEVFRDSAKLGTGIAKVWGDIEQKKVRVERVFPWELHVDLREARYGDPQNLFHVYDMERDIAIETFCNVEGDEEGNKRRKDAIESANSSRPDLLRVVESVKICEAWRLPINKDKPGKHAICIENATLFEEEWAFEHFPFVILNWNRDSIGFWSTGLAEEGESQQELVSDVSRRLQERIQICAQLRTYYNANVVKREDLEAGGESELLIPVQDMSQAPQTPPVQPASSAEFEWLKENVDRFYQMLGISQMTAQSQKPSGVTAAVAMQTLNDIQTVRFLPKARGYETAFVTLGKLFVQAARDIADDAGGYLVRWPGKNFVEEINWSDVSLEEDMYQIRVAPVSQYSRDPAAILEMAQELRAQGDISRDTFLEMIGLPDLQEMLDRATAEREYLGDLLDRYLDSTDDAELEDNGGYEAPEPYISDKPAAMALCISTYWEAKREKAPEFCLEQVRRFIGQLDKLMQPPPAPPVDPNAAAAVATGPQPVPAAMPAAA